MRLFATLLFLTICLPLYGDAYKAVDDAQKKQLISQVQNYFNGLKNLKAKFLQQKVSKTGQLLSSDKGCLYLKKTKGEMSSMRIDYETNDQLMIARRGTLYIIDKESKAVEDYSLKDVPALFILNKTVSLYRDCDVLKVLQNKDLYQIVTKPHGVIGGGDVELTLIFTKKPFFMFVGWILRDEHNTITVVSFMTDEVRINTKMNDDLFKVPST